MSTFVLAQPTLYANGEGILDAAEPSATSGLDLRTNPPIPVAYDADRDGTIDISDADDDSDDVLDGREATADVNGIAFSNPKDADTDDDGICDGREAYFGTDPIHPDEDKDGLSDGHEARLGSCTTDFRTDWSDPAAVLAPGRFRLQPYKGALDALDPSNTAHDVDKDNRIPTLDRDSDGDGMIDGLEDWDADGVLDPGESSPHFIDTDLDNISDSVELQVYGTEMTYETFLKEAYRRAGVQDLAVARARATWSSTNPIKTNPQSKHTDQDGIEDGFDIDPNDLNVPRIGLQLGQLAIHDPIDVCRPPGFGGCAARYWLDPYLLFTVGTVVGDLDVMTPNLAEVQLGGPGHEVDVATLGWSIINADQAKDGAKQIDGLLDGELLVTLDDDVRKMVNVISASPLAWDEVSFSVTLADWERQRGSVGGTDGRDESDTIDINETKGVSDRTRVIRFRLTQFAAPFGVDGRELIVAPLADGKQDGRKDSYTSFDHEDDGRLGMHVTTWVKAAFLNNAKAVTDPLRGQTPVTPSGVAYG